MQSLYKSDIDSTIICGNWRDPLEVFVPFPEEVSPIDIVSMDSRPIDYSNYKDSLHSDEAIIAHETTEDNATKILSNGFRSSEASLSPLRERSIFGWVHKNDICHLRDNARSNNDSIVIATVPENRIYISSYKSSAVQLAIGEITPQEYEREHIMKYEKYRKILKNSPQMLNHLKYNYDDLIASF